MLIIGTDKDGCMQVYGYGTVIWIDISPGVWTLFS